MREQDTHLFDEQATASLALSAPMASAPMRYKDDGSVDWGNMWDSFCVLASEGGPRHRPTMLLAPSEQNAALPPYREVVREIIRGIDEVSGLRAQDARPGWVAVECESPAMASWLAEAIVEENVQAQAVREKLFVPAGARFTVKGEIKNVITAVAKTSHYWREHLPIDVKRTLIFQAKLKEWRSGLLNFFSASNALIKTVWC